MPRRILVLGGTGFVGRHVVAKLAAAGHEVLVPTRRLSRAQHLAPLPTVEAVEADIHDWRSLDVLASRVEVVVNLVGILHESGSETFQRVHVELPAKLIAACGSAGVRRLLHMSALTAATDAASRYLRSKGEAEALLSASGLDWTIFRPSVIFGRGDSFLSLFARLLRPMPVVFLAAADARFQPVWVEDVAQCFAHAIEDGRTIRQRYQLCGPRVYTLRELVRLVADTCGTPRPIVALGPRLSRLQARALELLPVTLMTRDNLASMSVDNVCNGGFPEVFGVKPAALEAVAPEYLAPAAIRSRFDAFRARSRR